MSKLASAWVPPAVSFSHFSGRATERHAFSDRYGINRGRIAHRVVGAGVGRRPGGGDGCGTGWLPQSGPKRILVDFRDGWVVPAPFEASNRHAANLARHYTLLGGARIAYLSNPENREPSPVEQLAAARGYFYQRFTDYKAAVRWLG